MHKFRRSLLPLLLLIPLAVSCGSKEKPSPAESEPTTVPVSVTEPEEPSVSSTESVPDVPFVGPEEDPIVTKTREPKVIDENPVVPSNRSEEASFKRLGTASLSTDGEDLLMTHGNLTLRFQKGLDGYDVLIQTGETPMFLVKRPMKTFVRYENSSGSKKAEAVEGSYSEAEITNYGISAKGVLTTPNGTKISIEDKYYIATLKASEAINVERNISCSETARKDIGYESIYSIQTMDDAVDSLEYFVPNCVFGAFANPSATQKYQYYRETNLGMPMAMIRDSRTGHAAALARYQPVIDYSTGSYASLSVHNGETSSGDEAASIEITYPSRDTARHYFDFVKAPKAVYKMTIQGFDSDSYEEAMIESYNNQFTLQDQRILDVDIDDVYSIINEDSKVLIRSLTDKGITTWGLPCEIPIETGVSGSKSYQAGFTGQQIPMAYHMLLYGIMHDDATSIQNGINVLHFWVNSVHMMTEAGVPMIWYEGGQVRWMGYPTFTRMAVDAMEGLLDAYRVCEANGKATAEERASWLEAVTAAADWLVRAQNADGSWYRCYNYDGTYYDATTDTSGVTWDPGDVARSTSKTSSTMPVRFLGKMYELTGKEDYLNAIEAAGEFILRELYPQHYYMGGTCDNPDSIDREAGVFAMYAFDTLYTLTGEQRYLDALEEATVFTMSTVVVPSFKIDPTSSDAKAAKPLKSGYSDGLSFITCNFYGVDNFAAFAYYELFRTYIHTGKQVYLDEAEFIQENTKATMDYDGKWNYAYRSLVVEASTISSFGFSSVGNWLPWCSDANADPIARMYDHFGVADVGEFRDTPLTELRESLSAFGVGGKTHRAF